MDPQSFSEFNITDPIDPLLPNAPLAMAYVPMQPLEELYSPEVALERGTLFKALDLPFLGKGGHQG